MPIDPDNIRVDLLKIKRKLYLTYPEGSRERHDFLFATKLSELSYLSKLVSSETAEIVFNGYSKLMKVELLNIALCLGVGLSLSVMLLGFHQLHPTNTWLASYRVPFWLGAFWAGNHVWHMIDSWKNFQPFKIEYEVLQAKIVKLTKELRDLTK